jgi:hypothetical protein
MSKSDLGIGVVGGGAEVAGAYLAKSINNIAAVSKKPNHLIYIDNGKSKPTLFITLDRPDLLNGFVSAKGFYTTVDEKKVISGYVDLLTNVDKDLLCEELMPWHRILKMRSLVFKASK